jgi:TRAP transporter 4TM/12TM fusion protein
MAEETPSAAELTPENLEDIEYSGRKHDPRIAQVVGGIAALWSLFQLWIASPFPFWFDFGIIVDVPARGIHLAFGLLLCFLIFPFSRHRSSGRIPVYDLIIALLGTMCALYLYVEYDGLSMRVGTLVTWPLSLFGMDFVFPFEAVLGWCGILILLEATRRAIGLPLVIVASVFIIYSIFGQSMPDIISHKGVSLSRLAGYQWLGGEAIFGIPIDVSTSFVFLFVLFGAILDKAGAGKYFLDLAFSMVGQFRGGPAKAAILASGMTGLISGSSVANTVTTGTFTIPVMKRIGMPAVKAGAIEVAASVNGQIMPPIMGAAAFIIAEMVGITYFDVIVAAFIPAFIIYIALLYISHLEAMKLGLKSLPKEEIPPFLKTFLSGIHFIVPILILVYLLMVERWTASSAVFYSIMVLMIIVLGQKVVVAGREGTDIGAALMSGLRDIHTGLISGARNMITIAVAVATAGIIVGSVSSTGLNNALIGVVEAVSGGNVYIMLAMTAALCILLGMGLPTTANYLVVASLLAGVVVELGNAAGLVLPLIAVHLYVFYFGLMADVTPPVALAAFAASAISRADPIKTGLQAFYYEIRTAILPVVFLFNTELLLIGVESFWHGLMVFIVSLIAILCFSSMTQNYMLVRNKFYEGIMLAVVVVALFRPDFVLDLVSPSFKSVDMTKFAAREVTVEPGRNIRLHLVRETEYGDRFKLFVIKTPETTAKDEYGTYGLKMEPADDGRFEVTDVKMMGLAEKRGLEFGDYITDVDVEQVGRPPKEVIYPFALLLLGAIIGLQWVRWRREKEASAGAT